MLINLQSVLMCPQRCAQDCMPLNGPLITPLFAKPCAVFQISLYLFGLTSIFCANFNRLMHMQVQPL